MSEIRFDRNRSRVEDVLAHLLACEAAFTPPLGTRVTIPDYAAKLVARAERFEAWAGSDLIGLVAVYCDAPEARQGFVTSVSVLPDRPRSGLGRRLLGEAIAHARGLGLGRLALHVDRAAPALGLYRSLGFEIDTLSGETLHLSLDLREGGSAWTDQGT